MQIVNVNTVVNTQGATTHKERGTVLKRNNIIYEHIKEPVLIPQPRIEDFNSLVVVHDKMEYYS